jgi:hypothetical protein
MRLIRQLRDWYANDPHMAKLEISIVVLVLLVTLLAACCSG